MAAGMMPPLASTVTRRGSCFEPGKGGAGGRLMPAGDLRDFNRERWGNVTRS